MQKFTWNKEKWLLWKERFTNYWEKHGFAVVLLFCAGIIGVTALLGSRMQAEGAGLSPTPIPTLRALYTGDPAQQAIVATPPPSALPSPAPVTLDWPAKGAIQVGYHTDTLVYNETLGEYATHPAIDIALPDGGSVVVPMDGVVEAAYGDPALGNVVILSHENGLRTGYASLASLEGIQPGMAARRGMVLGQAGTSALYELAQGAHLHFFVTDRDGNPIDPMSLLAPEK